MGDSVPGTSSQSNNISQSSAALLECKICRMRYNLEDRIPRSLFCGHTVCEQCVKGILETDRLPKCPFDRELLDVDDSTSLPKNYVLTDYLEELKRQNHEEEDEEDEEDEEYPPAPKCEGNPKHKASVFCEQCAADLCEECFTQAHLPKFLANHNKVPIADKPYQFSKCPYHPNQLMVFLCEDGKSEPRLACQECIPTHSGHSHKNVQEEVYANKKVLEEALEMLNSDVNVQNAEIKMCHDLMESYGIGGSEISAKMDEISAHFDKMKEKAQKEFHGFVYFTYSTIKEPYAHNEKINALSLEAQKEVKYRLRHRTRWEHVGEFLKTSRLPKKIKRVHLLRDTVLAFPKPKELRVDCDKNFDKVSEFWDNVKLDENGKAIIPLIEKPHPSDAANN